MRVRSAAEQNWGDCQLDNQLQEASTRRLIHCTQSRDHEGRRAEGLGERKDRDSRRVRGTRNGAR